MHQPVTKLMCYVSPINTGLNCKHALLTFASVDEVDWLEYQLFVSSGLYLKKNKTVSSPGEIITRVIPLHPPSQS